MSIGCWNKSTEIFSLAESQRQKLKFTLLLANLKVSVHTNFTHLTLLSPYAFCFPLTSAGPQSYLQDPCCQDERREGHSF